MRNKGAWIAGLAGAALILTSTGCNELVRVNLATGLRDGVLGALDAVASEFLNNRLDLPAGEEGAEDEHGHEEEHGNDLFIGA